jgi:hypothetical protein
VAVKFCSAVATGTAAAFVISTFFPPVERFIKPHVHFPITLHSLQAIAVVLLLLVITVLNTSPAKIWRSAKLGLIPVSTWGWAVATAAFWVAYERQHAKSHGAA